MLDGLFFCIHILSLEPGHIIPGYMIPKTTQVVITLTPF